MSNTINQLSPRQCGINLFLVGFLVLFLELASIRWFSANVIFLQFFANVALIACFLGMSCGCLAARRNENWLAWFPFIALATIVAALAMLGIYTWSDGEPWGYAPWRAGEPNGAAVGQTCVKLAGPKPFGFADDDCEMKYPFLCERSPAGVAAP